MKILCTNNALATRGGSESYLETVAPALRQLGHHVELFTPTCGAVADRLRGHGFRVHDDPSTLGGDFDVIHGQHVNALAQVRSRLPETPLVFATHSWFIPIEDPVGELGPAAFIAFNDITLARLRAHAAVGDRPVHRLRQPIEVSFADRARTPVPSRASLAVVVSRTVRKRLPEIRAACERHGIRLQVVGAGGAESPDARVEMRAADLVMAIGRTALEGMAAGRAVLVVDDTSVGGWVTQESYARLEADNFTGLSAPAGESLEDLIGGYRPELGSSAAILAVRNHTAHRHAVDLVGIYREVIGTQPAPARVDPQVSLVLQASLALESRAVHTEVVLAQVQREGLLIKHDLASTRAELAATRAELAATRAELAATRAELAGIIGSRSWRLTAAARRSSEVARDVVAGRKASRRRRDAASGAEMGRTPTAIDLTAIDLTAIDLTAGPSQTPRPGPAAAAEWEGPSLAR